MGLLCSSALIVIVGKWVLFTTLHTVLSIFHGPYMFVTKLNVQWVWITLSRQKLNLLMGMDNAHESRNSFSKLTAHLHNFNYFWKYLDLVILLKGWWIYWVNHFPSWFNKFIIIKIIVDYFNFQPLMVKSRTRVLFFLGHTIVEIWSFTIYWKLSLLLFPRRL